MKFPRIVIAAAASGSGKTTATCCLIAGLRARGLRVAPFKVGPDFIDPSHLTRAAGRPARNIDPWMAGGAHQAMRLFAAGCADADIAVIEGVMGVFDGSDGPCPDSATSGVARLLDAPVVITFGARGMAETSGPLMKGLMQHDPLLKVVGAIASNTGSESHAASLAKALAASEVPFLGHILRDSELSMPERHLGLVPDAEMAPDTHLASWTRGAAKLDLDEMLRIAQEARELPLPEHFFCKPNPPEAGEAPILAVAQDAAFSFYYQDSLDALTCAGLQIKEFSPLRDEALPPGSSGLYLGGGFPELYAKDLSANRKMLESIHQAYLAGMPILAECGGFMSLCQSIEDFDGHVWPMAGIIPAQAVMGKRLAALGYREGELLQDGPLGQAGTLLRGHEFHYSKLTAQPEQAAFKLQRPNRRENPSLAGFAAGNLIASYLHLYLPGHPEAVQCFARACQSFNGA